jgi:transcriptional regulator with XRE-family HTH domain
LTAQASCDKKVEQQEKSIMLGQYLRELRKTSQLTCAQMADQLGCSVALVSLWERDGSRISAGQLCRYLDVLHATVWERDEALRKAGDSVQ